jgi:hypothetical protein
VKWLPSKFASSFGAELLQDAQVIAPIAMRNRNGGEALSSKKRPGNLGLQRHHVS